MFDFPIGLKRYINIKDTIQEIKPIYILEIGVLTGRNAEHMIRYAQNYNSFITYYGFDLFILLQKNKNNLKI